MDNADSSEATRTMQASAPDVRRATWRFAVALVLAFCAIYVDLFVLQAPFFAYLVCPPVLLAYLVLLLFKKLGIKVWLMQCVLGPPAVLLAVIFLTPALGQWHDRWILQEVRAWGGELRRQKSETGAYPASQTKFFHGYRASLINREPDAPAEVHFDRFGTIRQSYLIGDDRFLEKYAI